ncbi:nucleotidyltransferase domain-containing protein [Thiolapillus sp.]|uniref:nucleotidyltransferase domain-containing protein n=1 Tax=Thiolapillus sp. TaxID=2017437 RepID=UPI003AF6B785
MGESRGEGKNPTTTPPLPLGEGRGEGTPPSARANIPPPCAYHHATKPSSNKPPTAREIFGNARIHLFGSRVHDNLKGGDIDLLVESDHIIKDKEKKLLQLAARLQMRLGDQPIDILVLDPETPRQPIHEEALRQGVLL